MKDIPLGEHAFLVMTSLAAQPQHGYALMEAVHETTGGRVRLHAGTLYALLDRLRSAGLIEVDREETVQSRLRRYYRLTDAGAQRLATESAHLRRLAEAADRNLGLAARRRTRRGPALGGGVA